MRIDSHQHFWTYSESDYPWIARGSVLHQDYTPKELQPLLEQARIDRCIAVQARQSLEENAFLASLASGSSIICGIVGWIDLRSDEVHKQAEDFSKLPKAIGVRHVVQDEADPDFMAKDSFRRGIASLSTYDLVYDVLIYEHQLSDAIDLVKSFPDQQFVLDHIAKPKIRERSIQTWAAYMTELSHYRNVAVKLSGMITEADHQSWTADSLSPYWDAVYRLFGADRLMFGSDWPVVNLAGDYQKWITVVERWLADLKQDEREAIWGGTAESIYSRMSAWQH